MGQINSPFQPFSHQKVLEKSPCVIGLDWNILLLATSSFLANTFLKPLSANPMKWSNTFKQFTNCLSVFNHFMGLALKGLTNFSPVFAFFVNLFSFHGQYKTTSLSSRILTHLFAIMHLMRLYLLFLTATLVITRLLFKEIYPLQGISFWLYSPNKAMMWISKLLVIAYKEMFIAQSY